MACSKIKVATIVPVFDTPSEFLREALDSIVGQTLDREKFELQIFVYDDGSQLEETLTTLQEYTSKGLMYVLIAMMHRILANEGH